MDFQKRAFETLQNTANNYFAEHSYHEQDMSGSARIEFEATERESLQKAFLITIGNFEQGKFPQKAEYAMVDVELNKTYVKIMKQKFNEFMTIKKEGIPIISLSRLIVL